MPDRPRPIVIVGAGGIVNDAHLPAYRKAGFPVAALYDVEGASARKLSERWGNLPVLDDLEKAFDLGEVVFDLATPPQAHAAILGELPRGSAVLMQKPMGSNLSEAREILAICEERQITAAVNFQLRFAPMSLALRSLVESEAIGAITDADVHINILTPWGQFPFLKALERVEIAVHSIHYLDLLRYLIGEPAGAYAKTLSHPQSDLAQTRTSAILDYEDRIRCNLSINHHHRYGEKFERAEIRIEGSDGAAVADIGVLKDYPNGTDDRLTINTGKAWREIPLAGNWFTDAFVGPMANLQRFVAGDDSSLVSGVADAIRTMCLVEACFESSRKGGEPIPRP